MVAIGSSAACSRSPLIRRGAGSGSPFSARGVIVGELAVIDGGRDRHPCLRCRDCDLSFVSETEFEERATEHPKIFRYLVIVLASRLREADEAMAATSFMTVKARLARAVLEVAGYLGEDDGTGRVLIQHKISQEDLAAMAGVARENVSRVLGEWKRRKLVEILSSGHYCIHDLAALKRQIET